MNEFQGRVLRVRSRINAQEVLKRCSKNEPTEHSASKQHSMKLLSMTEADQVRADQRGTM